MELRHLLYFVTLSETLNFRRAAARLNISQPPLTVAIRNLEAELGAPLFVRSPRGVSLTPAGEAALGPALAALAEAGQVRQAVAESREGARGRLSIGFMGSAIYELLPFLIGRYQERYPNVELVLAESTSVEIVRHVRDRQLDVGLVRLPLTETAGIAISVVEHDELVAAVPSTSPLASLAPLPLSTLKAEPFIIYTRSSALRRIILSACHGAGFVPKVAQETNQVYTMLSLVRSGLGVALVPSKATRYVPDGVTLLGLREAQPIEAGIVVSADRSTPLVRNLLSLVPDLTR